jgi:hypothetical protein
MMRLKKRLSMMMERHSNVKTNGVWGMNTFLKFITASNCGFAVFGIFKNCEFLKRNPTPTELIISVILVLFSTFIAWANKYE